MKSELKLDIAFKSYGGFSDQQLVEVSETDSVFREEIFNGGSNPVFMDSRKRRTRREYVFDHAESESEERIQIRPSVQKLEVHGEQKYIRGSFVRD